MSSKNHCIRCGENAKFACSRCLERYCGIKCQRQDWYAHKKVCQEIPKLIRVETESVTFDDEQLDDEQEAFIDEVVNISISVDANKPKAACVDSTTLQKDEHLHLEETNRAIKELQILPAQHDNYHQLQLNETNSIQTLRKYSHQLQMNAIKSVKAQLEASTNDDQLQLDTKKSVTDTLQAPSPENLQSSNEIMEIITAKDEIRPLKLFFFNDLETIKLNEGKEINLIVTDDSLIDYFALPVVEYDTEHRLQLKKNLEKVAKYCKNVPKSYRGYCPQRNEICLAIYDEDGKWYRAYFIDQSPIGDIYELDFIDYGNLAKVSSANIMPITEELLFPTCVNFCRIINVEEEEIPALKAYIAKKRIINCNVSFVKTENIYNIFINNLDDILYKSKK